MDIDSTSVREAMAWVRDTSAIRQFIRAPYHGKLTSKGRNKFMYNDVSLSGLTKPLGRCFWPQEANKFARKKFYSLDPEKEKKKKDMKREDQPHLSQQPTPPPRKKITSSQPIRKRSDFFTPANPKSLVISLKKPIPNKNKNTPSKTNAIKPKPNPRRPPGIEAMRQGSKVHHQIDQVVKLGVNEFLEKNDSFHPFVLAIIVALHAFHPELRILGTEFLIGCPTLGIATRVDIICVDKDGTIYIVENKTGSSTEHIWSGHNGRMNGALEEYLGNSAHNRAKVQAIASAMLAILGTDLSLDRVRCLVAHVNNKEVKLELIPDEVTVKLGPIIYSALLTYMTRYRYQKSLKNIKQEKVPTKGQLRKCKK